MNFEDWKKQTVRKKAVWPACGKGYTRRQQRVTISLDNDMAQWLVNNVVGRSSFTCDLEETVITALRIARGELPAGYFPNPPKEKRQ
jgi:hypothetical protein